MGTAYALYSVRTTLPTQVGNNLQMINRKYRSEQIATTMDFFEKYPANPDVQSGLTAITVCVERKFLITEVYLNVHKLLAADVKIVYQTVPLYVKYVEDLGSKFPDLCHVVQGDYNPTKVNRHVLEQHRMDMEALGFTKLPSVSAIGRVTLDWTFTKGVSRSDGGECSDIFETRADTLTSVLHILCLKDAYIQETFQKNYH